MIFASNTVGSAASHTVLLMVLLLSVTLLVALISKRLRLPYTLILVVVGLLLGFLPILSEITFNPDIVLFLFLPPLLFEGAWNVDITQIAADWLPIVLLAGPGLLLAVAILATTLHLAIGLPWLLAILLGAIISPTDPVVVLSLLKQLGLPERLCIVVEGESLFNDGVGVAVFGIVLGLLLPSLGMAAVTGNFGHLSGLTITLASLWLLLGGPLLGLVMGWIVARFLLLVDDHLIETTVTFSVAYGAYLLGDTLHTSGLLTVVGAGLVIGSYGRNRQMSQHAQETAQEVWEFIAYLANSLLFLLLGIQIGASHFLDALPGIFWAVLGIIGGRFLMVYLLVPVQNVLARRIARGRTLRFLPKPRPLPANWHPVFVLAGLHGALSLALVLSLPVKFVQRKLLEDIVYGVVLVTLLGQGLALRFLLPYWPIVAEDVP
ncbi:MAG: cation:proton antiporter [Ktedonobacteraceae bacterium]